MSPGFDIENEASGAGEQPELRGLSESIPDMLVGSWHLGYSQSRVCQGLEEEEGLEEEVCFFPERKERLGPEE